MLIIEKIANEKILEALERGEFDHLEGKGKPLAKEESYLRVAPELRLAYKIMKNANILPEEIETLKEIERLEELLSTIDDENEKYCNIRKMNSLVTKFNLMRNTPVSLEKKQYYLHKLSQKIFKA